jgi:hypothetical protein
MKDDAQAYQEYARDCVRLAWQVPDDKIRDQLLEMARDWMALSVSRMTHQRDLKVAYPTIERLRSWHVHAACAKRS